MLHHQFSMNERGNIWLMNFEENQHNAWFLLERRNAGHHLWLEVSIRPGNYPGFNIHTIITTEEELAKHINSSFGGNEQWGVRKCNIEGVVVKEGVVQA